MKTRKRKPVNKEFGDDLELFITSNYVLYKRWHEPIIDSLVRKKKRGVYVHSKAVKAFRHLVDDGAKKYAKDLECGVWYHVFNVPTRDYVAESLTDSFEMEYDLGNYN